jgi:hypothetical protein
MGEASVLRPRASGRRRWRRWDNARDLVRDHCMYGAASRAQLDRCRAQLLAGEVNNGGTPAARFARDREGECGVGSGPFCERVSARRLRDALAESP